MNELQYCWRWGPLGHVQTCCYHLVSGGGRDAAAANIVCTIFSVSAVMHWTTTLGNLDETYHSSRCLPIDRDNYLTNYLYPQRLWALHKIHCEKSEQISRFNHECLTCHISWHSELVNPAITQPFIQEDPLFGGPITHEAPIYTETTTKKIFGILQR